MKVIFNNVLKYEECVSEEILCSWIQRWIIINVSVPKLIYQLNVTLTKISAEFFKNSQMILEVILSDKKDKQRNFH